MFSESLSALGKHIVEALHPHTQVIPVVIETLSKKGERLFPGLVEIGDEIFSSKVTWKKLKRAGKQGSGRWLWVKNVGTWVVRKVSP
jgi:hypothetical protein